jgi:hypothetical protein
VKTTSFGSITARYPADKPDIIIEMKVPGSPLLSLELSPDEAMIFLVEIGNGLTSCRHKELQGLIARTLQKEQQR